MYFLSPSRPSPVLSLPYPPSLSDWQPAIGVAVLDCAQEEHFDLCKEYGIKFYPTFKVRAVTTAAVVPRCSTSAPFSRYFLCPVLCSISRLTLRPQTEGPSTQVRERPTVAVATACNRF